MNNPTGTNIGANLILAAFGTAVIAPLITDTYSFYAPSTTISYQNLTENSWDEEIVISSLQTDQRFISLKAFSDILLKNSQDIDTEILHELNKNFWDLI